jgi:hypothetical protein
LATPRTITGAIIGRLRQSRAAMISRAMTATRRAGNEISAPIVSQTGMRDETRQTIRPSSHNPTSIANSPPLTGSRPVQLGIAVNRKPAMAAMTKPNNISWMCQASGSNRLGISIPAVSMMIHSASAAADQSPAAIKKGLKPRDRKVGVGDLSQFWVALLISRR